MRAFILVIAGCGRIGFGGVAPGDAESDADMDAPRGPLVAMNQPADLVLGQPDFNTGSPGVVSATSLDRPEGITSDGTRLWVHDNGNARILMWSSLPTMTHQGADVVIGQIDMMTKVPATSQTKFPVNGNQWEFDSSFTDGQRLYVANHNGGRVMIWDPIPTTTGAPMQVVIGADNFTTCCSANPAAQFGDPTGIWTDGTQLIVSDIHGHRVLIWPNVPTTNGVAASLVLGRPDFTLNGVPLSPPTASSLRSPHGVLVHNVRLFVADSENHRILVWNQVPTTLNAPADFVIGQPDFTSNARNGGATIPSGSSLSFPNELRIVDDHLLESDTGNNRILVFSPVPSATGAAAITVLGQPSLTVADPMPPPAPDRFRKPVAMAVVGDALFVTDQDNHRVLRFSLAR
jgi:hypothetical protein